MRMSLLIAIFSLRAAEDPAVETADIAQKVRVTGQRDNDACPLYRREHQQDPKLAGKVLEVLYDQPKRGQVCCCWKLKRRCVIPTLWWRWAPYAKTNQMKRLEELFLTEYMD